MGREEKRILWSLFAGGMGGGGQVRKAEPRSPQWLQKGGGGGRARGELGRRGRRISICECGPVALYYVLSCL